MTTPADTLRAAAWIDGDPLMETIAAAVYEQCGTHPEQSLTVDDPRNIAAVAAAVARQVLGTTTGQPETEAPAVDVLLVAADCPYGTGPGDGSGCIKPSGHNGDHIVTPGVTVVPCSQAVLHQSHIPHAWSPQPGMAYVHCPGATPAPAEGELTDGERQFLAYALHLADEQMASGGGVFSEDDRAALVKFQRLAKAGCTCGNVNEAWIETPHTVDCAATEEPTR